MKKNVTAAELPGLVRALEAVFETVTVETPADGAPVADGLQVAYQSSLDDVCCELTRPIRVDGERRLVRMRGILAESAVAESGLSEREMQMMRDDLIRDFLTGAYNRDFWLNTARLRLQSAAEAGRSAAMALVSVDGYPAIARKYGAEDAAQLICYVANLWKKYYDEGDEKVVCRLDENLFAIGCTGADELDLEIQMRTVYEGMHLVCTSTHGMLCRIPFTLSAACAGFDEAADADAVAALCKERLAAVEANGGNAVAKA